MDAHDYRRTHLSGKALAPATQMLNYGYDPFLSEGAVKPPVFLTSTFAFRTAQDAARHFERLSSPSDGRAASEGQLVYSRFNHPNLEMVEDRLALLDGSSAAAVTASGMAAITTTLLALLEPGDVLLHSAPLYGGTETLLRGQLQRWGVKTRRLSVELDPQRWATQLGEARQLGRLRVIYIETPANPTNEMLDFEMLAEALDIAFPDPDARPLVVCDNTLLGPLLQQPARYGIDLCVYSLTKYVGGHSDLVAGGVTGRGELVESVRKLRSSLGTQLDPHTCWLIGRSMETLTLRMQRACESAEMVAAWLAANTHLRCRVLHPRHDLSAQSKRIFSAQASAAGSTFSFDLEGGREAAFAVLNRLRLFKLAVSLGGSESLACHPASTTHSGVASADRESSGISEGLVRISVGLEDPQDLIIDLDQAFRGAREGEA